MSDLEPYYTIIIPFVPREFATEWHPTEDKGPFMRLTRGNFKTVDAAITWGREKLAGTPYEVKRVENELVITVIIEHDAKFNTWLVSDDGGRFESAMYYGAHVAAVEVNARHDFYVALEPTCTILTRTVSK